MNARAWALQRGAFGRGHRCVAIDNRGTGHSDAPPGPYDLVRMAQDAIEVLDAENIPRAHVVGASMGGVIAQILGVLYPDRVHSLTLACTACRHHGWRRELLAEWADEVTAYLGVETRTGHIFVTVFHLGEPADADRRLAPLRALGTPVHADFGPRLYTEANAASHHSFPEGHHHRWRACFLDTLDDGAIEALAAHARAAGVYIVIEHLGGAMGRMASTATAFPHRGARFGVAVAVKWRPPETPPAAAEELHAALWPSASGTYVNYLNADYTAEDVVAAYRLNLPRLSLLKGRYDPGNVFRSNVNLPVTT